MFRVDLIDGCRQNTSGTSVVGDVKSRDKCRHEVLVIEVAIIVPITFFERRIIRDAVFVFSSLKDKL